MRISVIGAGSWGTAMAAHLAGLGHEVSLWAREREVAEGIRARGLNPLYLSDVDLPAGIDAHTDMERVLGGAELVVTAVPSRWTREVAALAAPFVPAAAPVLNLSKGFDPAGGLRLSQAIAEELGHGAARRVAALSGPNHAEEVARKVPSATVVASEDPALSRALQSAVSSPYLRVYTNGDIVGVEVGGAYKNIVAIAAGVLDGLGLGDNTKAALITRGLAEMARFGSALGASPITFSGLSGVGDLIVTCMSRHSRNRGFGEALGAGASAAAPRQGGMVVEGVYATRAVLRLAQGLRVETPVALAVQALCEEKASPADMLEGLMTRRLKEESEEELYRHFLLGRG